jgi:hypothetical protein
VPPYDQQTEDQTHLQDAAVKSATSLIAVVNDMLRSPLASARLPPPSSTLALPQGRPRSRTAPSTPLVEMPSHSLVELPGSIPDRPQASNHHSFDSKRQPVMRPNSHLKRPPLPWLHFPGDHKNNTPAEENWKANPPRHDPRSTLRDQENTGLTATTCRYSKPASHPRRIWSDPIQSHGTLHPDSLTSRPNNMADRQTLQPSMIPRPTDDECQPYDRSSLSDEDGARLAHVSSLQASHEAHVAALTEAHQREIASLHLYITQIEPRCVLARAGEVHAHKPGRQHTRHRSANTNRHSNKLPLSWDHDSNTANQTNATIDPHCTSSANCGELYLECNHLRTTLQTTTTTLSQANQTIHRLQRTEQTLKTTIQDLRSRLLAANDSRLDVQEGFHAACCRVRALAEREATLVHELREARKHCPVPVLSPKNTMRRTPPYTPSPPLSPLGFSIPRTPPTVSSATTETLLVTTESPDAYTHPRTPQAGVHKELPLLPADLGLLLHRDDTVKSVAESIIELYAGGDGDGWAEWV